MNRSNQYERYHRQIILKEFGETGQDKLLEAKVLVIGVGGLGCPVLHYLVAAGVGTIGIVDDDIVSISNLHRQLLFDMNDIGELKTRQAAIKLLRLNPDARIDQYPLRLTNQNAIPIFEKYDVVVDASDNFPTRYLVNDACVLLGLPLVYGAVSKFEGQLAVFNLMSGMNRSTVNYRDLFPAFPAQNEILNCAEAGVIGVLPGVIGTAMAGEVIKLITGMGKVLVNRLQTFNLLYNQWDSWDLTSNAESKLLIPTDREAYIMKDYNIQCAGSNFLEISTTEFEHLRVQHESTVIDVREFGEEPLVNEFMHIQIPLSTLEQSDYPLNTNTLIAFCQSGQRSAKAAQLLSGRFPTKQVYSLKSGILHWKTYINTNNHE